MNLLELEVKSCFGKLQEVQFAQGNQMIGHNQLKTQRGARSCLMIGWSPGQLWSADDPDEHVWWFAYEGRSVTGQGLSSIS